jgi:alpha-L-rhamnosidase
LGLFELQINGRKVGHHVLEPALSQYEKRAYYQTLDVTHQLSRGSNAVGLILGNGRFCAPRQTVPAATVTYGWPKALLQLDLEYVNGSTAQLVTDASWKVATNGPIRANNEYDGEEYDARLEMNGWSRPGFDDVAWQPARIVAPGTPLLSALRSEPIEVMGTLHPVAVTHPRPGVYIYDMGQNMVGWCRLRVRGPRGARVVLRHAETLCPDGTLYTNNLRSAKATDAYTLKGKGLETYEPRFTYHGFRYVELTGFPGTPALDDLQGRVVHDALNSAGDFACSNPLLNRIYHNVIWGTIGNYRSIPTDCPQRDERQGWLGDRSEESKGESYMFDVAAFYFDRQHLRRRSFLLAVLQRRNRLARHLHYHFPDALRSVRRFERLADPLRRDEEMGRLHGRLSRAGPDAAQFVWRLVRASRVADRSSFE